VKYPLPDPVLSRHIAFLGKTGSGKTTSAKGAVEHVLRTDPTARVCVLDPIKSDWWGLTSSANGKSAGFPFQILGGPHGHVPLHASAGKAVGELVGRGALPLSIIDMADFGMGGLQQFFNDFAPALMRSMTGVLYLVLEEAHEFAPKERAGIANENMSVYFAKKLATAGRSKGIRLILVTQRTQQLHNALLGSCDTVVAHRLTAPADQGPVKEWLKAHFDKATFEKVADSLAKLRTGTGFVCSSEMEVAGESEFPKLTTFDNSATPTGNGGRLEVKTAPVDREKLRAIMGDAVKEAEANDVPALKKRIRELELEVARKPAPAAIDPAALEAERQRGFREGRDAGANEMSRQWGKRVDAFREAHVAAMSGLVEPMPLLPPLAPAPIVSSSTKPASAASRIPPAAASPAAPQAVADGLSGPQQSILDALAWLESVGVRPADKARVAWLANVSPNSSGFQNNIGRLRKVLGLVAYPTGGKVELTDKGRALANRPQTPPDNATLHAGIKAKLPGPQWAIFEALIGVYPTSISREQLATGLGVSVDSSGYQNNLGSLRSIGLIDYPERGMVRALPVLFVE